MLDWFKEVFPNVVTYQDELLKSVGQTLYMSLVAGAIAFVIGLMLGVLLIVTKKDGILANKYVYQVLDKVINVMRSIPFIVLVAALLPLTRMLVGTGIGVKGVMFPLIIGTIPFMSRQIESALAQIDKGLIEAAVSMGCSPIEIIFRVYLKESIPSITRGWTISYISLINLTAMVGAVGGGGIGDFVIRYGHGRNMVDITYISIFIILTVVSIAQAIGNLIIKKTTH